MRAHPARTLLLCAVVTGALATPALAAPESNAPAHTVAGHATKYAPPLTFAPGGTLFVPRGLLATRVEAVDAFAVDADGAALDPGANVDVLLRAGLEFNSYESLAPWLIGAELELDIVTGLLTDGPDLEGEGLPNEGGVDGLALRKAFATISYKGIWTFRGGAMTSHWGLGLLANDGAQWWQPGSAMFTDPRGGDRVLRGQLIGKTPGSVSVAGSVGIDKVIEDDVLLAGDEAWQLIAALRLDAPGGEVGVYAVRRFQDTRDGGEIDVWAVDLFGQLELELSPAVALTLATEWALVAGTTTLAPSADFPEHDILQLGGVVRAELDAGDVGGVLDFVYASGDRNTDDDVQNAFKADPNFDQGVLLFPYVVAAQTGRSAFNARAPDLIGYPPDDLERLPTRGSVSNTVAFFPRLFVRPLDGLELYGGALFAFADVDPVDPLNTRLAGGDTRNAFDRAPGDYLGTELDLGVRYRLVIYGTELTVGAEAAALFMGSALDGTGLGEVGSVYGGRFMLSYRL